MALTETFLRRSRDLWIKKEAKAKADAAHAHEMHKHRSEQLAAAQAAAKPRVVMPVRNTDMAKNTNGWTGPNGHDGIDLLTPENEPLLAMCKSRVVRVSPGGWWGNNPQPSPGHPISDGDGIIILECLVTAGPFKPGMHLGYGHAEHATVKPGDVVEAGQVIGKAGFARLPHVHFMLNDDAPVNGLYRGVGDRDPLPYLRWVKEQA